MALSKSEIKATYPLPAYNYRVTVESDEVSFSEISGLNVEYEPVTYKHGFSFVFGDKIIPGMQQPIKLTMKKGIVRAKHQDAESDQVNDVLQCWFDEAYQNPFSLKSKRDIQIDLCDEEGKAVVRWTVRGALPMKMDAPTFDASSNDVAIETMEVVAHGLEVNYDPT